MSGKRFVYIVPQALTSLVLRCGLANLYDRAFTKMFYAEYDNLPDLWDTKPDEKETPQ